jgi:hypothetical protein
MYDHRKGRFTFLPFSGGYLEQELKNPVLWQAINYVINYCYFIEFWKFEGG